MFVAQPGLSRRLAVELLDKMNNPDNPPLYIDKDEDDLEVIYTESVCKSDRKTDKCDMWTSSKSMFLFIQ